MSEVIKNLTCINCPLGCSLVVTMNDGEVVSVTGNNCPRGDIYARSEVVNPKRVVTSSVKVVGGSRAVVSVKTESAIPKEKIFECVNVMRDVSVNAPVRIGDVVIDNVAETGVRLVATSNVDKTTN